MSTVDYFVTKIKRGNKPLSNAITELYCRVAEDEGKSMGVGSFQTKANVINQIKNGLVFKTAILKEGKYHVGDKIIVVADKYLRTDGNNIEEDNLGNLPEE